MERQMAEANRAIGIARAAFFPDIRLSADGGILDAGFDIAKLTAAMWSHGATVFLAGLPGWLSSRAIAAHLVGLS